MSLEQVSPFAWIQKHNLLTSTGQPFDFHSHLYLFDPLCDLSPQQVTMKCAQIGYSESIGVAKMIWAVHSYGLDAIYVLPTDTDSRKFVSGKVNRIIAQNPILQEYVKDKDAVEQKQIGQNVIYYQGSWTPRTAIMVSADVVVMDEYDQSRQETLGMFSSRMQHSKYRWQWLFSNPTYPGQGVHRFWQLSDKRHWIITCPHCEERQYLSWPESVDQTAQTYVCKGCREVLDDETRRVGEWVALGPVDAKWRGYWINLLMNPEVPASRIIEYFKTKTAEYFSTMVLGLPHAGSGNTVTQDMIYRNLTDAVNPQDGRIVIGVDTGKELHFVVGNERGLFYYGAAKGYEDIERMMKRWPQSIVVMDEGGDIIGSRKLRETYPGRVFLCHYAADRKTLQLVRWGANDENGHVTADRNRMMQLVIDELTDRRIPLQGSREDWYDFWIHFSHIYRTSEEDNLGITRYVWERSDDDHWAHSCIYWRIGMSRFGGAGSVMRLDGETKGIETTIDPANARLKDFYQDTKPYDWRNI